MKLEMWFMGFRGVAGRAVAVLLGAVVLSLPAMAAGIVGQIQRAGIAPDGNVAGAVTDIVINLAPSLDPAEEGLSLLAGDTVTVTLPQAFQNSGEPPLADLASSPDCAPGNLQCTTAVLLQGWPQNPVPPPNYTLSMDGDNTLVYTMLADFVADPPAVPGIKQIHLIFKSFTNPGPGLYPVAVQIQSAIGGMQEGAGFAVILPSGFKNINITNAFSDDDPNPPNPNTNYQQVGPGETIPLPWEFLLWDEFGEPLVGVEVMLLSQSFGVIVRDDQVVGQALIGTPDGATGHAVLPMGPSFQIDSTPVVGPSLPTARWSVGFQAGDAVGRYSVRFRLFGGNTVEMFVDVIAGG